VKRYLAEGAGVLSAKDKQEASDLSAMLEPLTTATKFVVNEDGADVFVDDEKVGTSPIADAAVVDSGMRRIRVTKEGFKPYETTASVAGSAQMTLEIHLEKEIHEGRLVVNAPADATIAIDGLDVAKGKLENAIPSGGHQLRVTAVGMRAYQSEVVIQDNELRSVDVTLEKDAAPALPIVGVSVLCNGRIASPEDGLELFIDDSTTFIGAASGVERDPSGQQTTRVDYPVAPGHHLLRLRARGCVGERKDVLVTSEGASLTGALAADLGFFESGPAGNPDGLRLFAGGWIPEINGGDFSDFDHAAVLGAMLSVGYTHRWFTFLADAAYASGIVRGIILSDVSARQETSRLGGRAGLRLPLQFAALSSGLGLAYESRELSHLSFALNEISATNCFNGACFTPDLPLAVFSGWFSIDIEPLCDWLASVQVTVDDAVVSPGGVPLGGTLAFGFGYQPNSTCRRERALRPGLGP